MKALILPAAAALQLAAGAACAQAVIPFKRAEAEPAAGVLQVVLALAVCAALLGLVLWQLRRRPGIAAALGVPAAAGAPLVRVRERQRLNPRTTLYVVEFGGMQHLLSHTEQGVACLASAASAPPVKELP